MDATHTTARGAPAGADATRKWWTLAAVCTGVFMLLLDITIVNVALPDIGRAFGASLADLQWVISAYALTLAAFLLTGGSLADLYGRRRLFAGGILVFTAGSLLCGLATGTGFLIAARAGQGVGGAVMFATSLALLAQAFQGKERGVALGIFGAVTGVALAVGPVLGGAITSGLSWRWIFYVNVPIGVVAFAVTVLRVDESRNPAATRPDWLGFATFSTALAALVYGLIESQSDGWGSRTVTGSLAASAVLLVAFLAAERFGREPMLDLSLLRVPTFDGGLAAAWAISAALFSLVTYIVIYLQDVLGYSAVGAGVRFLPMTVAIFVSAGIAGRLTSHVPRRLLIAPGFLLISAGLLLMRGLTASSDWTHLLAGMIVAGIGAGLVNVPLISTAVGVVDPARAGMASGINSTLRQVGIATGVATLGTILASRTRDAALERLQASPLAAHAHALAHALSTGGTPRAAAATPPSLRGTLLETARGAYAAGLDRILLVGAAIALVAAVASFVLIRERDFVATGDELAELAVAA